jgi:2-haloalkanoic acid dehalogenase type II
MIRFLTFDCYGTLIDWKKGIEENFAKFFSRAGGELKQNQSIFEKYVSLEIQEEGVAYKNYGHVLEETSTKLAKNLGLRFSEDAGQRFANSIGEWPAFPDSTPTLKILGKLGYKRTILSNIDRVLLEGTIRNNDLEIDGFITAQDVKSYKPNKEHWLEFLRSSGARREELVHVANSIHHDIIPANDLGIRTVWVNRYGEKSPTVTSPDFTVRSISELPSIFERINS